MGVEHRRNPFTAQVLFSMHIVGHDIEKVDVFLEIRNIKMLEIPIRGGQCNAYSIAATS
jgi:hypothetical protein